ncbi:S1 family peptidase [Pelagicoccus mobilis]|uniref:Serine protease n=1 Tax=Pelagicoccus mobilis TaxID=415221 RepID=A0A934VR08_9BACT|nr:serine protease [Pelagicoccus mobilis]MBK1878902.1 serine protease [Pelagicoccus mobilis]
MIKQLSIVLKLTAVCSLLASDPTIKPSIVGGEDVDEKDYPWISALVRSSESDESAAERQFCGGVLVAPNWILTAAHCVDNTLPQDFEIIVGNKDLDKEYIPTRPRSIHIHPSHHDRRILRGCDLALIEIDPPIEDLEPIHISKSLSYIVPGRKVQAMGWGLTSFEDDTNTATLKEVELTLSDLSDFHPEHPAHDHIIATEDVSPIAKGINSGDSGSPLVVKNSDSDEWILLGITSTSNTPTNTNTTTSASYSSTAKNIEWIERIIGSTSTQPIEIPVFDRIQQVIGRNGTVYTGYKIWPFAGNRKETISFRYLPSMSRREDEIMDSSTIRYKHAGNGAFYFLDISPGWDLNTASIADLEIERKRNYSFPLVELNPFETIIINSLKNDGSQETFKYMLRYSSLVNGQNYEVISNAASIDTVASEELTTGNLTWIAGRRFRGSSAKSHWVKVENLWSTGSVTVFPSKKTTVEQSEQATGILNTESPIYRSPHKRIELLEFTRFPATDECKIVVNPEFDAEIIVLNRDNYMEIGYADQGSANELDELIVSTNDIARGMIGVYNFDKDATGKFDISIEPYPSQELEFGERQHRGITSADKYYTDRLGHDNWYERHLVTNDQNFESITVEIQGLFFHPGVAIFDPEGEVIEFEYGKRFQTLTFQSEPNATYTIDVINFGGKPVENYRILVEEAAAEQSADPSSNPPTTIRSYSQKEFFVRPIGRSSQKKRLSPPPFRELDR